MHKHFTYILLSGLLFIVSSCALMEPEVPGAEVIREAGKIFIRDQTGKRWDVTHAVEEYGFDPAAFQHGLGPTAIKPIQNPQMLRPGDAGYPGDYNETVVLGAELQGDARAYPLNVMIRHEIANEQFGNSHVAVAYWPLVELTAVYSREIDGNILNLSASGWTYRRTFVLFDFETESIWYHLAGTDGLTCISGKYADRRLDEFASSRTRWSDWVTNHPNSGYLNY